MSFPPGPFRLSCVKRVLPDFQPLILAPAMVALRAGARPASAARAPARTKAAARRRAALLRARKVRMSGGGLSKGRSTVEFRLFGRLHSPDMDTARAAATRPAAEPPRTLC